MAQFHIYRELDSTFERRRENAPHRLMRFEVVARAAICAQLLFTVTLGWFTPHSLTYKLFESGGTPAFMVLLGMSALLMLAILDMALNDFLGGRFGVDFLKRHRVVLYCYIAATYAINAFADASSGLDPSSVLKLSYLATAFVSGWYAFVATIWSIHASA